MKPLVKLPTGEVMFVPTYEEVIEAGRVASRARYEAERNPSLASAAKEAELRHRDLITAFAKGAW